MLTIKKKQIEDIEPIVREKFIQTIKPLLQELYPYMMFQLSDESYIAQINRLIEYSHKWEMETEHQLSTFIIMNFELGFEFWKKKEYENFAIILNSRFITAQEKLDEITQKIFSQKESQIVN